jgi:hypothetical protein
MKDDQPWMTPNIKQMIKKRQKLYNQSYTDDDNSKWRKLANTIRYKITQRKRQYFSCFKNKDSKKWWKVVNNFNGKGKRKEDISLTAEELNEGFHQVWSNGTRTDLSSFITTTYQIPYNITPYAVLQELNKLDTSKAPGPDNINNKLLKSARHELCDIIAHLFNTSIAHSFVPTQWKMANIAPLAKISNPSVASDYRPIALTSSL